LFNSHKFHTTNGQLLNVVILQIPVFVVHVNVVLRKEIVNANDRQNNVRINAEELAGVTKNG
jgi:hypothetical protein